MSLKIVKNILLVLVITVSYSIFLKLFYKFGILVGQFIRYYVSIC